MLTRLTNTWRPGVSAGILWHAVAGGSGCLQLRPVPEQQITPSCLAPPPERDVVLMSYDDTLSITLGDGFNATAIAWPVHGGVLGGRVYQCLSRCRPLRSCHPTC